MKFCCVDKFQKCINLATTVSKWINSLGGGCVQRSAMTMLSPDNASTDTRRAVGPQWLWTRSLLDLLRVLRVNDPDDKEIMHMLNEPRFVLDAMRKSYPHTTKPENQLFRCPLISFVRLLADSVGVHSSSDTVQRLSSLYDIIKTASTFAVRHDLYVLRRV